jgi:hypothetical protein
LAEIVDRPNFPMDSAVWIPGSRFARPGMTKAPDD